MSKEQRDAEMDQILDLAVAQENSRLAQIGLSPEDVIEYEGQKYLAAAVPVPARYLEPEPEPECDLYREAIEAQPEELSTATTKKDIERRLDEIRGRVMSYDRQIREDIGFLLTVIDASR